MQTTWNETPDKRSSFLQLVGSLENILELVAGQSYLTLENNDDKKQTDDDYCYHSLADDSAL